MHPFLPRVPCLVGDSGVCHPGDVRVRERRGCRNVAEARRRGAGCRGRAFALRLAENLGAGGGIRLARLFHASANDALEVLVAGHRLISFGCTATHSPAARRGERKGRRYRVRESAPLCLPRDSGWGGVREVRRGPAPPTEWSPRSGRSREGVSFGQAVHPLPIFSCECGRSTSPRLPFWRVLPWPIRNSRQAPLKSTKPSRFSGPSTPASSIGSGW